MPFVTGNTGIASPAASHQASTLPKTPLAKSKYPLLGVCAAAMGSTNELSFWLDESRGTGTGYDHLVLDANGNGDLTDDPPLNKLPHRPPIPLDPHHEYAAFGPIALPMYATNQWLPQVYAEMHLFNHQDLTNASDEAYVGTVRMLPANYLGTTVHLNGRPIALGILDGDASLAVSNLAALDYSSSETSQTNYSLSVRSVLLVDRNGSGAIESDAFLPEAEPYSRMVDLAGKCWQLDLAQDLSAISLKPATNTLCRFRVPKETTQIIMARRVEGEAYDILTPEIRSGTVWVPAGEYRIARFQIGIRPPSGAWARTSTDEMIDHLVSVKPGKTRQISLGLPLSITMTVRYALGEESDTVAMEAGGSSLPAGRALRSAELYVNVTVSGKQGETYTSFEDARGEDSLMPTYSISTAAGKVLDAGRFSFG